MALLNWSERYSVGVKQLDGQHMQLVDTLNSLHDGMMKGEAQKVTGALLMKLVDYTHNHFATEEKIFASTKYPAADRHRAEHTALTRQVEDFVDRYDRGEIALNVQLLNFLRDWLTTHILKEDKEYGPWLNKAGIK
jgi:hemerythrin-like metal-binding protein